MENKHVREKVNAVKVKFMSYNTQHCLNYVTKKIDFDLIANTIKNCGADVIGLQEMRDLGEHTEYEAQTKILSEKLGFPYYYFARAILFDGKNPYGNAIISRYPIIGAETVMIPDPEVRGYSGYYETRCILRAKIDVGEGVEVFVSHFGLNPDEQKNAVKTVVDNLPKRKCVLMGDFNMSPDDAILQPIMDLLFDTAKLFQQPKLSFPSDKPEWKIDYIFSTKDLFVSFADIPEIISSDHRPHVAIIEV